MDLDWVALVEGGAHSSLGSTGLGSCSLCPQAPWPHVHSQAIVTLHQGPSVLDAASAVVRSCARCSPLGPVPPPHPSPRSLPDGLWLLCPPSPTLREWPSSPSQHWGPLPSPGGLCPLSPVPCPSHPPRSLYLGHPASGHPHQQPKGLQNDPSDGVPYSPSSPAPRRQPGKVRPSPSSSLGPRPLLTIISRHPLPPAMAHLHQTPCCSSAAQGVP